MGFPQQLKSERLIMKNSFSRGEKWNT